MYLVISLFLVTSIAVLAAASLRVKPAVARLLLIYLIIFTNISLSGHIAHLLGLMNDKWFYIIFEGIIALLVFIIWLRRGRPSIFPYTLKIKLSSLLPYAKKNPDVAILTLVVVIAIGIQLYLALTVPPNNNDSLAMHVPRVLYWLQHGNYKPWNTARVAQIFYPVNAQLQILRFGVFSKSTTFFAIPQFFAAIFGAIAVAGIAQLLNNHKTGHLMAGLSFLTYPIIVTQSTTTQNDLVVGTLFGICVYFLFLFSKEQRSLFLYFSGLSIALAVGTKLTATFLLPGIGIILLIMLIYKKMKLKGLLHWGLASAISITIMGAQIFYQNWNTFGNPLGAKETVDKALHATNSVKTASHQIMMSSFKFLYQIVDPSGLPSPLWRWGVRAKAISAGYAFDLLNIDIEDPNLTVNNHPFRLTDYTLLQEDESFFGITGFFTLIPLSIFAFYLGIKRKNVILLTPIIMFTTFLLTLTALRPGWTPYQGRYFIPIALVATSPFPIITQNKPIRYSLVPLLVVANILILMNTMLYNPAKPLLDYHVPLFYRSSYDPQYNEILHYEKLSSLSYIEKITYQTKSHAPLCNFFESTLPSTAIVAYIATTNDYRFEVCLFGEHFEREVIPVYPYYDVINNQSSIPVSADYLFLYRPTNELLLTMQQYELIAKLEDSNAYIFMLGNE
jgi:hypothetical protein